MANLKNKRLKRTSISKQLVRSASQTTEPINTMPASTLSTPLPPVLAILTVDNGKRSFLGNRGNFRDIIRKGQKMGFIVYVLPVKQLFLNREYVKGFVYAEDSRSWREELMPAPHIIYNRIPSRNHERLPEVRSKLLACKKHPKISIFNPYFFNKWQLFKWLRESKTTLAAVPHTKRLTSINGLEGMLQKHSHLYLKPVSGKAGKGIMTVSHHLENALPYRLKIQQNRKSSTYRSASLKKLWLRIQKERQNDSYIVQQGITLASYHDRNYDLRALIQKNNKGRWEITGLGARLAGALSITTHVPRGGRIEEPEKLLRHAFNEDQAANIILLARKTALQTARQIERGSKNKLGEMSMDLGVDVKGNVWVFEANAKPMKFDEPHIRQKSLEQIFHYAYYLMAKKRKATEGVVVER